MQKYTVSLPGTTSAATHYLPIPDAGKIIGAYVALSAVQSNAAGNYVSVGKGGATNALFVADTASMAAGDMKALGANASATNAERAQMFGGTVPVAVNIKLQAAAEVGLTVLVDEYGINGLRP